jgi:DNA-binding transcriptional ArsR family regulator
VRGVGAALERRLLGASRLPGVTLVLMLGFSSSWWTGFCALSPSTGSALLCVCEFTDTLVLKQPTVSYHLKQLVDAGLISRERRGTFAYYRLVPGALDRLGALLAPPPTAAAA